MISRRQADRDTSLLGAGFADALIAGQGAQAEAIALGARGASLSLAAVHGRVITPAMYAIGDLWARGEITVADEHLATVICHRVLAALHGTIRGNPDHVRARVLLATPAGQRHSLGLRMVADVLENAGYGVTYLGADVPPEGLCRAVERHEPDVLGLSLTTADGAESLAQAIGAARAARRDMPILLGGQGVRAHLLGDRMRHVTDIERAVSAVEELLDDTEIPCRRPRPSPPARAADVVPPPAATVEEHLVRAAEEIGEIARAHARRADRFRALAFEDELCRLPNRRAFDDRFRELAVAHGEPGAPPLTVMVLDLDNLKAINDDFGHDAGDEALCIIARALRAQLREQDLPARLGGDEFGALLPGVDPAAAIEIAERVCRAIRDGSGSDGPAITASCGIARFDGDRRRTLICADESLLDAKRAGRDRVLAASSTTRSGMM